MEDSCGNGSDKIRLMEDFCSLSNHSSSCLKNISSSSRSSEEINHPLPPTFSSRWATVDGPVSVQIISAWDKTQAIAVYTGVFP
ncbi:MAG: hypothetical protein Q6362_012545 [Candidatus Wukongarchaeota archaeon]|nr:hypothetical protein [Candidatus Wukongarchaeota archaeon]MDO8130238.1 hypothetical protein [Candidatus Wukongarchaeota archaeon]